jgi:CRP/FNR family cyclic AMP-dependent transcriptional regulator
MDAIRTLSRCPLLREFTATGLQILASIAEVHAVPGGTPIFVEGMVGDAMHVVAAGRVRLSVRAPAGDEVPLGALAAGEHFGELSLVMPGSQRLVTATADGEVELVTIRQRDFARLQAQKPQACLKLALAISGSLGQRLGENREVLGSLLASAARR